MVCGSVLGSLPRAAGAWLRQWCGRPQRGWVLGPVYRQPAEGAGVGGPQAGVRVGPCQAPCLGCPGCRVHSGAAPARLPPSAASRPGSVLPPYLYPEEGPGKAHPPVSTSLVQGPGLPAAWDPGPIPGAQQCASCLVGRRRDMLWRCQAGLGGWGRLPGVAPPSLDSRSEERPMALATSAAVPPSPGVRPPLVRSLPRLWRLTTGA